MDSALYLCNSIGLQNAKETLNEYNCALYLCNSIGLQNYLYCIY